MRKYDKALQSNLTGKDIPVGAFEESLQEFTQDRLADSEDLATYKNQYKKLNELLDISRNDEAVHTLVGLQSAVAHSNYIKGFAEGMKFALMAEKL